MRVAVAIGIVLFAALSVGCAILFGKFAKAGSGDAIESIDEERL